MNAGNKIFWGILLAAGESSRMNDWKPAVKIGGKELIKHSLELLNKFCQKVIIVGGYNFEKLRSLLSVDFIESNLSMLTYNEDYSNGMLSSVQKGLEVLPEEIDGIIIIPADMPFVKHTTVETLIKAFETESEYEVFIPTTLINNERQKKGHPILVRASAIPVISNYDKSKTLRDVIKTLKVQLCEVDDEGIVFDIDEQKDLEKAINYKYKFLG